MAFYYYKLWRLLDIKRISQNELQRITGISQPTFTKMRKGQSVTVDTLEKIATALGCDFGDIITVKPDDKQETTQVAFSYDAAMLAIQDTLKQYMDKYSMTALEVADVTTLSVNTIRSCLKGNNISSRSLLKLNRLEGFATMLNLSAYKYRAVNPSKTIYCTKCGRRRTTCWGFQNIWNPNKKEYEHYCGFNFNQTVDDDGHYMSFDGNCPHPTNYHEFADAELKYGFTQRKKGYCIPAKNDNNNY